MEGYQIMQWIYVGGTFDLFHVGHVKFLKQCQAYGLVVVGLNSDDFTERFKRRPIIAYEDRLAVVRACRYVDYVVPNHGDADSTLAITALIEDGFRIKMIGHGSDWPLYLTVDGQEVGLMKQMNLSGEWLKEKGIIMLVVHREPDSVSTTNLLEKVRG